MDGCFHSAPQGLLSKRENRQHREDTGGYRSLVSKMALFIFEPVKKRILCQLATGNVLVTEKILCVGGFKMKLG